MKIDLGAAAVCNSSAKISLPKCTLIKNVPWNHAGSQIQCTDWKAYKCYFYHATPRVALKEHLLWCTAFFLKLLLCEKCLMAVPRSPCPLLTKSCFCRNHEVVCGQQGC